MNFIKCKNKLIIPEYTVKDLVNHYGKIDEGKFKGITYSNLETGFRDQIFALVPEEFRNFFGIKLMKVNWTIPPHIDSGITATINCYINTDNCLTQFYCIKPTVTQLTEPKWSPPTQTNGRIYSSNDLDETDSFVAESGDVYLLNVSSPHSVKRPPGSNFVNRIAVSLQSNKFNFDQMAEMLETTGNL